jgi:hypothetical protein
MGEILNQPETVPMFIFIHPSPIRRMGEGSQGEGSKNFFFS